MNFIPSNQPYLYFEQQLENENCCYIFLIRLFNFAEAPHTYFCNADNFEVFQVNC